MAVQRIVIETRRMADGFQATVVEGPEWSRHFSETAQGLEDACFYLRVRLRGARDGNDTFEFIHTQNEG